MSSRLFECVEQLIGYGLEHQLMDELDVEVTRNQLWRKLNIECDLLTVKADTNQVADIYRLLDEMTELAKSLGTPLDYGYEIEMFQAELMSLIMPRNSEVNRIFWAYHQASPQFASQYFYDLSNASTYIRMDRVSKNISWKSPSEYGELDITINCSKPEKDPKEIALQKNAKPSVYPKCLLCVENAGYSGNINHPARHNHRIVEMTLANEPWYLQYSPYVYYNEHAIVLCREHRDMKIDRDTFVRLCDFVDYLPHYFIGSNADLHTVGGSILTHDHYQAGNYEMPMMRAKTIFSHVPESFPSVRIDVIDWPLTVLKLVSDDRASIEDLSTIILKQWIDYSDERVELTAHTFERHNTITPILRKVDGVYEMYLALRNNRKDERHPDGIFHPHREHHHIKRENIGLIEVMGLAVLPARLVEEMEEAIDLLVQMVPTGHVDLKRFIASEKVAKHAEWIATLIPEVEACYADCVKSSSDFASSLDRLLKDGIGRKFGEVLKDAGIYKRDFEKLKPFFSLCERGK